MTSTTTQQEIEQASALELVELLSVEVPNLLTPACSWCGQRHELTVGCEGLDQ